MQETKVGFSQRLMDVLIIVPVGMGVRMSERVRESMVSQAERDARATGKVRWTDRAILFFAAPERHPEIDARLDRARQQYRQN